MTNHYHLVIETLEGNWSHGMRQLNGVYTQQVNRKYERDGHVFRGDYTMQTITTTFSVHYTTVSKEVRRHKAATDRQMHDCKT